MSHVSWLNGLSSLIVIWSYLTAPSDNELNVQLSVEGALFEQLGIQVDSRKTHRFTARCRSTERYPSCLLIYSVSTTSRMMTVATFRHSSWRRPMKCATVIVCHYSSHQQVHLNLVDARDRHDSRCPVLPSAFRIASDSGDA